MAYSISFNSSNVGKFFLKLNSKGLYQSSGKEKESCSLLFLSLKKKKKSEIRHFHVVVVQRRLRNVQKGVIHVQSCCFASLNLLIFSVLVAVAVDVAQLPKDKTKQKNRECN